VGSAVISSFPETGFVLNIQFVQQLGISSALHTGLWLLLMSPGEAEAHGQDPLMFSVASSLAGLGKWKREG